MECRVSKRFIDREKIVAGAFDVLVLGSSFYLSCVLLAIQADSNILMKTSLYAIIVFLSVTIGKWLLRPSLKFASETVRMMIIRAIGLLFGAIIMVLYGYITPELGEHVFAIVLASIMAFFIFGTLTPLLNTRRNPVQ